MAKELPYFKFEPNQWENGNIQMLSREDKGLFIDLCCMYWSRLGDVPLKLAIQKICGGNATALDSLCDEKIIEVINGNIFIKFLSEQLSEFNDISNQNAKNAKEGWEKRRKDKSLSGGNATALTSHSDGNAIREEKRRENEKKEDKINNIEERKLKFASTLNEYLPIYGRELLNQFYAYWTEPNKSKSKFRQELEKTWDLKRRLETWAKNEKNFTRPANDKKNIVEQRNDTLNEFLKSL